MNKKVHQYGLGFSLCWVSLIGVVPESIATVYDMEVLDSPGNNLVIHAYGADMNANGNVVGNVKLRSKFTPEDSKNCRQSGSAVDCYLESNRRDYIANDFAVEGSSNNWSFTSISDSAVDPQDIAAWRPSPQGGYPSSKKYGYAISDGGVTGGAISAVQTTHIDQNTNITYYIREFDLRAYTNNGTTFTWLPPDLNSTSYRGVNVGGVSVVAGFSGNNAVGYVSIDLTNAAQAEIDACIARYTPDADMIEVCVQEKRLKPSNNLPKITYQHRASYWSSGNLQLLAFPPQTEFTTGKWPAIPLAIALGGVNHSSGTILYGRSHRQSVFDSRKILQLGSYWRNIPTIPEGELETIYYDSSMNASAVNASVNINNEVIMTGYYSRSFQEIERQKGYYYLMPNSGLSNSAKRPFFYELKGVSSANNDFSVVVADIAEVNTEAVMVGTMEVSSGRGPSFIRSVHGFQYNLNTVQDPSDDELIDLNETLECADKGFNPDGSSVIETVNGISFAKKVVITQALRVNGNGTILANALVRQPHINLDAEGFAILNGGSYFTTGYTDQVSKIVLLNPKPGGTACPYHHVVTNRAKKYERQGASFSWLLLLVLGALVYSRKRQKSHFS